MFTGFPEHWTTLKKLMFAVGSGIIGGASAIWKTVTGAFIHITDALASPMQKCEVTIEPVQSGSGDPSPENVRPISGRAGCEITHTGQNMLNAVSENILRYSSSYGNYTFADGVVTITGKTLMGFKCKVKPNTTYTVAYRKSNTVDQVAVRVREFSQEPTGWESTGFIEQSVNTNHTSNNNIGAWFTTTAQTTWIIVAIYRSGAPSETLTVSKWSLVLGERAYTDVIESYESYSGTTYPITFPALGVNQWNEQWANGYWNHNDDGAFVENASYVASKSKIPVKPSTSYFWYCPTKVREVLFYDANGDFLSYKTFAGDQSATSFETPDGCYYIAFYMGATYGTTYNNDISINYPSTDTSYHAYTNTVYGGTNEIVSGTLTSEWDRFDLGQLTWSKSGSRFESQYLQSNDRYDKSSGKITVMCETYKAIANCMSSEFNSNANDFEICCNPSAARAYFMVKDSRYSTKEELKTALNGIYAIVKLYDQYKHSYEIEPVAVNALQGENNIWADCGDVEITYKAQA